LHKKPKLQVLKVFKPVMMEQNQQQFAKGKQGIKKDEEVPRMIQKK